MIERQKNLAQLGIGESCTIEKLNNTGAMLRRLLDLGIVPGTRITASFAAPGKNPVAYIVRGTVIALRCEDSQNIVVV